MVIHAFLGNKIEFSFNKVLLTSNENTFCNFQYFSNPKNKLGLSCVKLTTAQTSLATHPTVAGTGSMAELQHGIYGHGGR